MIKTIIKCFKTVGCTVIWAGAFVSAVDILSRLSEKIYKYYQEKHQ